MMTFILLAAALAAVAAALVAVPLAKKDANKAGAPWAAFASGLSVVVGAAAIYVTLSDWSWRKPEAATTPQGMVAQLARRLERDPEDLNGWLMLGRSYTVLGQFPLAARAYQRADRLAGGRNVDALIGLAEALTLENEAQLDGRAGRLFEQAIALDPTSGKALFYGAAAALRRGELPLARQRFARLLELNPPDEVKRVLRVQIDAIDQQLAGHANAP